MEIRRPLPRPLHKDIFNPPNDVLADLAISRMRHIVQPDHENLPPVLFPLAESMRWDFFTFDDWHKYGDLETEYARLTYTLSRYPERGPPITCENVLRDLLDRDSVLTTWLSVVLPLEAHAATALDDVVRRLRNGRVVGRGCASKADLVTVPIDYEACRSACGLTLQLWERSLDEIATRLAAGDSSGALPFLQIHAYLKDPIHGLTKPLQVQRSLFATLWNKFRSTVEIQSLSHDQLKKVAAQAAQESSYLANPLLDKVALVHFEAHHQLTYVHIPLNSLSRAEFGVPLHVLEVAEEMLLAVAANNGKACPLVPILVTTRPNISKSTMTTPKTDNDDKDKYNYLIPIVDGNHRVTATLLLRFLATQPILADQTLMSSLLLSYCTSHGLGKKWQIDLLDVLQELYQPSSTKTDYKYLLQTSALSKSILPLFANVTTIPALVVQEEDFHTICKQRSANQPNPTLLHPFHQSLFNDDDLPFALPQKAGQTHGRPEAFRLLPLLPFGLVQGVQQQTGHDDDNDKIEFRAELRQSMAGLTKEGFI